MNKILIWGTGNVAEKLLKNGVNGTILGFIETKRTTKEYYDKPIYEPEELPLEYDFIIIANTYADEIYRTCLEKKIGLDKVIFLYVVKRQEGFADCIKIKEILGEKNYVNYAGEYGILENTFFQEDMIQYSQLNIRENFQIQKKNLYPIITDKYEQAGTIHNYFWQDLWAARLIHKSGVRKHFDIGSRIDGFIAHLLSGGIEVSLIDIREFPETIENLYTIIDDATSLKQVSDNSIESMSALCSLEHFGLGRYGDPIDPEACFKCFKAIQKKLKKGGNLYMSVPIGKERVEFNAHRVFFASTIIENFEGMELVEFSCTANGKIEYSVDIYRYDDDSHYGDYRYGLFHFVKK